MNFRPSAGIQGLHQYSDLINIKSEQSKLNGP